MSTAAKNHEALSRRDALKALIAVTGAATLASLPEGWKTPLVSVGTLPAHAQVSPCGPAGRLAARAVTTTRVEGEYADFDFSACTPNGHYVWGGISGDGATSSEDNIAFDPHVDYETITIPPCSAVPGVYTLYLEDWESDVPISVTVTITTEAGTYVFDVNLTETRSVASISYPGGIVVGQNETGFPACVGAGAAATKQKK